MDDLEEDLLKKFDETNKDTQDKLATASGYRDRLLSILKDNLKVPTDSKVNQGELYIDGCYFSADLKIYLSDFIEDYLAFCESNCQRDFRDTLGNPIITANYVETGINYESTVFSVRISSQTFTYRFSGTLNGGISEATMFGIHVTLNKEETQDAD